MLLLAEFMAFGSKLPPLPALNCNEPEEVPLEEEPDPLVLPEPLDVMELVGDDDPVPLEVPVEVPDPLVIEDVPDAVPVPLIENGIDPLLLEDVPLPLEVPLEVPDPLVIPNGIDPVPPEELDEVPDPLVIENGIEPLPPVEELVPLDVPDEVPEPPLVPLPEETDDTDALGVGLCVTA